MWKVSVPLPIGKILGQDLCFYDANLAMSGEKVGHVLISLVNFGNVVSIRYCQRQEWKAKGLKIFF